MVSVLILAGRIAAKRANAARIQAKLDKRKENTNATQTK